MEPVHHIKEAGKMNKTKNEYNALVSKLIMLADDKISQIELIKIQYVNEFLLTGGLMQNFIHFINNEFNIIFRDLYNSEYFSELYSTKISILKFSSHSLTRFFRSVVEREIKMRSGKSPFINIDIGIFNDQFSLKDELIGDSIKVTKYILKKRYKYYHTLSLIKDEKFILNGKNKFFTYKEGVIVIRQLLLNGEVDKCGEVTIMVTMPTKEKAVLAISIKRYENGQLRIFEGLNGSKYDELCPGHIFYLKEN